MNDFLDLNLTPYEEDKLIRKMVELDGNIITIDDMKDIYMKIKNLDCNDSYYLDLLASALIRIK